MRKKVLGNTITVEKADQTVSAGGWTHSEATLQFYRDRKVEPPTGLEQAAAAPTGTEQAAAALDRTKQRIISPMPIVVSYQAKIPRVRQVSTQAGEIVFQTTSSRFMDEIFRDAMDGKTQVGVLQGWIDRIRDAYTVRDEFLKVTTEREALDFLRENGEFLPYDQQISWVNFKRWQRYAELVYRERDKLSAAHTAIFATGETDPTGELDQVLRMLAGYPHTYFGDPPPPPTPQELDSPRRACKVTSETPRQAAEHYQKALAQMNEGAAIAHQRQQELECWFYAPPPSAYSVQFIPKERDAELERNMQRGGVLFDYFMDQDKVRPVLVIYPRCALEAIAAAIYAERVASVRVGICESCGKLFEIEDHNEKRFCDRLCQDRKKKQKKREAIALKKALALASQTQPPDRA
jgi:hypothetical protein